MSNRHVGLSRDLTHADKVTRHLPMSSTASEEIIHRIVFTGALRGHLQTNNFVLICNLFAHNATHSRRPSLRLSRRCLFQDQASCTPLQGRLCPVFSFTHSSAVRGVEVIEPSITHHSLRHPLFRLWKLPKMPSPLATGWFVLVHVRYPERQSTSHFPGVPVPAARFVLQYPIVLELVID